MLMTDYKCISCGSIKESEENCSCPVCGYKMFAMPYDRKEQLLTEIQSFISYLKKETVLREELIFEGKDNDDSRFPNYNKILRYVSSKDRTEDFLASLLETVEQLRLHYATQFSNTYRVSFSSIDEEIEKRDNVLLAVAKILIPELKIELKPVEWPVFSVLYAEIPDKYLWSSASELLGMIEKLAREIARFIKLNNLYGNGHKYYPAKKGEDNKKGTDYKDRLEDAILDTEICC